MTLKLYYYSKCSTCRQAIKWLDRHKLSYEKIDIVLQPPSIDVLADMWKRSQLPLEKFFNVSGESYRRGNFKEKLITMSDDMRLQCLSSDGKLIKRPIIVDRDKILIGFNEEKYQILLIPS